MAKSGGGPWKGVFWLIVIEIIICIIVALWINSGGIDMGADAHPSKHEAKLAGWVRGAWVKHNEIKQADPVEVNDQTLLAGAALYQGNCAACHGGENYAKSPLGRGVYPGAPQFMRFVEFERTHPGMMKHHPTAAQEQAREDHSFMTIKHGIRFTAMPSWKYSMTDTQIWEVVNFMQNMGNLPPNVEQAWKQMPMSPVAQPAVATPNTGTGPAAGATK